MKQETAAKFAEILAAAQGKTQPTKQQPAAPKQPTAAKKQQPAPIPTPQPEPQKAIYCSPAPFVMMPPASAKSSPSTIKLIQYSEKAVAVIGETKPIKEKLKQLGGRFNMFLSCGAGWVFPKTKEVAIIAALNL